MRVLSIAFVSLILLSTTGWENDFEFAQKKAQSEHKFILINFSGSDWCGPCIRLHKDFFEKEAFESFATDHLVLVNADFPRLNKNKLSKEQQKKNDKLADKFNSQGSFPLTLLLNEKGKVVKTWDGYPDLSPEQFVEQIKTIIDVSN